MKKLLITLLLISPFSFADWGDVYYCEMTSYSETTIQGERTDYKLEKFTFKLDKTKNAMVFGKKGYFKDYELELDQIRGGSPSIGIWVAGGDYSELFFDRDKFIFVAVGYVTHAASQSISADCEKF